MTWRGQFKEDGVPHCFCVWKQHGGKLLIQTPKTPWYPLLRNSGKLLQANKFTEWLPWSAEKFEKQRKPKNVGMLKQVSSAKVNFSSWNSDHLHLESVVQQFLRSRCYTGQQHPQVGLHRLRSPNKYCWACVVECFNWPDIQPSDFHSPNHLKFKGSSITHIPTSVKLHLNFINMCVNYMYVFDI